MLHRYYLLSTDRRGLGMGIILKKWRGIAMEKKINDYFEEICKTQTVYSYGDKYLYRMSKDTLENIETK